MMVPAISFAGLADKAERWEGRHFNYGKTAQCAAWVGDVVKQSGGTPPSGYAKCTRWLSWGKSVPASMMRRGDIVIYASNGSYNHIGIYKGNGKIVHRPTRYAKVRTMNVHYRRILGVRRGSGFSSSSDFNILEAIFRKLTNI